MFSSGLKFVFIAETREKLFCEWSIPDCTRFCGVAKTHLYLVTYGKVKWSLLKLEGKELYNSSRTVMQTWSSSHQKRVWGSCFAVGCFY